MFLRYPRRISKDTGHSDLEENALYHSCFLPSPRQAPFSNTSILHYYSIIVTAVGVWLFNIPRKKEANKKY
jgi:hypothetical protein